MLLLLLLLPYLQELDLKWQHPASHCHPVTVAT
jgi:hypothetical protein